MFKSATLFTLILVFAAGCQPKRERADFSAEFPQPVSLAEYQTNRSLDPVQIEDTQESLNIELPQIYRFAENLDALAKTYSQFSYFSNQLNQQILKYQPKIKNLDDSAYVRLFIENALPQVKASTEDISKQIEADSKLIESATLKAKIDLPADVSISKMGVLIAKALDRFTNEVVGQEIHPALKAKLVEEITSQKSKFQNLFEKLDQVSEGKVSFLKYIIAVDQLIQTANFKVSFGEINRAKVLGKVIEKIKDGQSALRAIIEIWKILEPKDRKTIIGALNNDLYEYLNDQNKKGLDCLAKDDCGDLFKTIAKEIKIIPAIEEYGVYKIKSQMNKKAIAYVDSKMATELRSILAKLPQMLKSNIQEQIQLNVQKITTFDDTFAKQFKKRFAKWATNQLPANMNFASKPANGILQATIKNGTLSLENLVKAEATPYSNSAWVSYATTVANDVSEGPTDLRKQLALSLIEWSSEQYLARSKAPTKTEFSPNTFASEVRALSLLSSYLADWRYSNYSTLLGQHMLSEIFTDLPKDSLGYQIFPQNSFYPISLQITGDRLLQLQQEPSPIITIDTARVVAPYGTKTESESMAVMAVILGQLHGGEQTQISSADVSETILALSEFVLSSANIDLTQAPLLLKKDFFGQPEVQKLVDARTKIRQLLYGLCNFLSNQLRNPQGLIVPSVYIPSLMQSSIQKTQLRDQALAIRALNLASKALGIDIYKWEGIAIAKGLIASLPKIDVGFYHLPADKAGSRLFDNVELVLTLEHFKIGLNQADAAVIEEIQKPILTMLERYRLSDI